MKMKIYYVILLLILFISCTKEVEYRNVNSPELPVINCLNKEGSKLKIYLSKTNSIFSNQDIVISSATINIFTNDSLTETLILDSITSSCISNNNTEAGKIYKISGNINFNQGVYQIETLDTLPYYPVVNNMYFSDSVLFDEDGIPISELRIQFIDIPNVRNFYEVSLYAEYFCESWEEPEFNIVNVSHIYNIHTVFQNEGLMQYYPQSFLFSDVLFDGKQINLPFRYSKVEYISGDDNIQTTYKLIVKVRSVSSTYYKYKKLLTIHQWNQTGDIWDGVGEPFDMYTNITGGYGIFATFCEKVDTLVKNY